MTKSKRRLEKVRKRGVRARKRAKWDAVGGVMTKNFVELLNRPSLFMQLASVSP